MTAVLDTAADVGLPAFARVAWAGEGVAFSPAALERMDATRRAFLALVESSAGERHYGITTAHHKGALSLLTDTARAEYATRVPTTPPGVGTDRLPERLVRGVVLARLAAFLAGTGPVRSATAVRVAALLDGPLPPIPARGHGEPGDIILLGTLFRSALAVDAAEPGRGTGEPAAAGIAGGQRLELGEGMALINGAPVAAAALADGTLAGAGHLAAAEIALGLAAEAARAPAAHYDAALGEQWGDPHQAAALERFRALLAGGHPERLGHQAAVSFRSAPRLLGGLRRVQAQAAEAATISLRSGTENPAFTGDAILSNGGYHDPLASPSLNALARGWADLATLACHQVNRLVEDPAGLVATEPEAQVSLLYMTAAGATDEARAAAKPTLLGLAGGGQTDTGTPDLLAWRLATETGAALRGVLACLTVVAAHTIERAGRTPGPALDPHHRAALTSFPLGLDPRDYGPALAAVAAALAPTAPAA